MGTFKTMITNLGHFILLLLGFLPGSFCCEGDGSEAPVCEDWVNSAGHPFYFPHQSNCSKFWMCGPNLTPCLFECPPMSDGGSLYFNAQLNVCDWPDNVECTAEEAGESEECEEGEECESSEECEEGEDCESSEECEEGEECESSEECEDGEDCESSEECEEGEECTSSEEGEEGEEEEGGEEEEVTTTAPRPATSLNATCDND